MPVVTTELQLRDAITAAEPDITVQNDITLSSAINIGYAVHIHSDNATATLLWGGTANKTMFTVLSGGALTLTGIRLDGAGQYHTLVGIDGGECLLNTGTVLTNTKSNSGSQAVRVGKMADLSIGGTLTMRDSLITGIQLDAVISCNGGTVNLLGSAAIRDNSAYVIGATQSIVNMGGQSRIHSNTAQRPGMGILATSGTVVNMGLQEGDAPEIYGNESTTSYAGAIYLVESTLNMAYGAAIYDNKAASLAGGIGLMNSAMHMSGQAEVRGNIAGSGGGGIFVSTDSVVTLDEDASVTGNRILAANGLGGGIYAQNDAVVLLHGNALISANEAYDGAGIYLKAGAGLTAGGDPSDMPSITENAAVNRGGGLYIAEDGTASLSAGTSFSDNTAGGCGAGIYQAGRLEISGDITVADGLYYDKAETAAVITAPLSEDAAIQLETSGHCHPDNIPVLLGKKGDAYGALTVTDQSCFYLPDCFPENTAIYRNAEATQIFAGLTLDILAGIRISIRRIEHP